MRHADDGGDIGSLCGVFTDVDALIDRHGLAALDFEATERQALFGHGGGDASSSIVFENACVGLGFEGFRFRTRLVSATLSSAALSSTALTTALSATLTPALTALLATALSAAALLRGVGFGLGLGDFLSARG